MIKKNTHARARRRTAEMHPLASEMTRSQRARTIALLGSLTAIGPFSIDMYLPGFSSIASDLHTSVASVGYSLTSYFIGIAFGQLVYGPLTDRFGRRKPLLVGLAIYFAATFLCAVSPSIGWLIAMRLLMALGGCVGFVVSRAIARDVFPISDIPGVFSSFMLIIAISPILAPSVGGYVSENLSWRAIFFILATISAVLIVLVITRLRESKTPDAGVSLRPRRLFERYRDVGTNRQFIVFAVVAGLGSAAMFGYISGAPFVFMHLYGLSQTQFGWVFALNASALIGGSQFNRVLIKRLPSETIAVLAITGECVAGAALLLCGLLGGLPLGVLLALTMTFMFCGGYIMPNASTVALEPFAESAGTASALMGCVQMSLGALSTAIVSIVANGTMLPMVAAMFGSAVISRILLASYVRRRRAHEAQVPCRT